jgi:hypothetical protein
MILAQCLDIATEVMLLSRVPQIDLFPLAAERFLAAPVSVHDLAVQDHVRGALFQRALQCLLQSRRPAASTSVTSSR